MAGSLVLQVVVEPPRLMDSVCKKQAYFLFIYLSVFQILQCQRETKRTDDRRKPSEVKMRIKEENHGLINYIDNKAKCRHLK